MGLFDKKEDNNISMGNAPVTPEDNEPGVMPIENVFGIPGNCVVMGKVTEGSFSVGDEVMICHANGSVTKTTVKAIEAGLMQMFDIVSKGRSASIQLVDVDKSAVKPGAVLKKIV